MLMFKKKLTTFVGALDRARVKELDEALRLALDIGRV